VWFVHVVNVVVVRQFVMENLRELVRNNGDLVNYLLTNAFNKLSYDDKVFIKQLDRPTPSLNSLVNTNKNSSNRKFI
jgi:hypothetical protein